MRVRWRAEHARRRLWWLVAQVAGLVRLALDLPLDVPLVLELQVISPVTSSRRQAVVMVRASVPL